MSRLICLAIQIGALRSGPHEGLKAIVKRPGKSSSEVKEALDFILSHPYVMPTPIIMEGNNHFIGYNEDEIRIFLPKEYRRHRP
ncbi:ArsC/Spx/MgsR family protein [Lactococcus petauri]|uniref:ArsC/Spx/MgsR family protein n=1 Tax=Lactococcus petauri TaxID=1940789 RepID=UPI0025502187|nr:ArsC/Spx/MgsR family protein [Lactococcus petauri]